MSKTPFLCNRINNLVIENHSKPLSQILQNKIFHTHLIFTKIRNVAKPRKKKWNFIIKNYKKNLIVKTSYRMYKSSITFILSSKCNFQFKIKFYKNRWKNMFSGGDFFFYTYKKLQKKTFVTHRNLFSKTNLKLYIGRYLCTHKRNLVESSTNAFLSFYFCIQLV